MKTFFCIMLILLLLGLSNCSYKFKQAPKDAVPLRTKIDQHPFGGYTVVTNRQNNIFYGELIGNRNDTLVILNSQMSLIPVKDISTGKVLFFRPYNFVKTWLLMSIPTALPLVHIVEYGAAPLLLMASLTGFNFLGSFPAIAVEGGFKNYHLYEEDSLSFMKYSRFPAGIPPQLDLTQLAAPEQFHVLVKD